VRGIEFESSNNFIGHFSGTEAVGEC
jgi:hypothetical protein